MGENRKATYVVETMGNEETFIGEVKKIKGVLNAGYRSDTREFFYEIDEWSSDYDVFTEVLQAAEATGTVFDFGLTDKKNKEKTADAAKKAVENGDEEGNAEVLESVGSRDEGKAEKSVKKKRRKVLPDWAQRVIELGVAAVAFVLGLIFKDSEYAVLMCYAIAFAASGYEILYDAAAGFFKKRPFGGKLLLSLALIGSLFLGSPSATVAATLIFAVAELICKVSVDRAARKSPVELAPEKCVKAKGGKTSEIRGEDVKAGDVLVLEKGGTCAFSGTLTTPYATVVRECNGDDNEKNGQEIETDLEKGDKVFKGDRFLTDGRVRADCGFYENSTAFERAYVKKSKDESRLKTFVEKRGQMLVCGLIAAFLAATFLLALCFGDYKSGLYSVGSAVVAMAASFGFVFVLAEERFGTFTAAENSAARGILPFSADDAKAVCSAKTVYFDYENALLNDDGKLKEDARGAIRETRDCMKKSKIALLTLLSEEQAAEVCKKLKINEYYCFENEEEKALRVKTLAEENSLFVTSSSFVKKLEEENDVNEKDEKAQTEEGSAAKTGKGLFVVLDCDKTDDYSASACVKSGEIAYVPYVVKLGKKQSAAFKTAVALDVISKIAVIILAAFGAAPVWAAALAACLAGGISFATAFVICREN